jgi:hypothetical protein
MRMMLCSENPYGSMLRFWGIENPAVSWDWRGRFISRNPGNNWVISEVLF